MAFSDLVNDTSPANLQAMNELLTAVGANTDAIEALAPYQNVIAAGITVTGTTITEKEVAITGLTASHIVCVTPTNAAGAALAGLHVAPSTDALTLTFTEASPSGATFDVIAFEPKAA